METSKILSASWLDILFENRNKDYGAYQLRNTYSKRVTKALLITAGFAGLAFGLMSLNFKPRENKPVTDDPGGIMLKIIEETKPVEPELPKPPETKPPEVKTVQFTSTISIKEVVENPVPDQDQIKTADINSFKADGLDATNIVRPPDDLPPGTNTGIIDLPVKKEDNIESSVDVQAKYTGNWIRFLERNLDPQVPLEHNAPDGRYTVMIQFVVDKEGKVSDIRALTAFGYGMEEEAIRVIRKADKWEPALQRGFKVKAYRRQPITFVVESE